MVDARITATIAAIATPVGRGGIGVIRVSGPYASSLAKTITTFTLKPRYAHYGLFYHPVDKSVIDQGITLFFPAPHSFTGEDVLELQTHGSPVVLDLLLQAIVSQGVRLARPGEFSERAYLNNKMDLIQAEAVADLIDASSQQAARNAINSLQGLFSQRIQSLAEQLKQLRVYVEAAIDFPEEEIDFLKGSKVASNLIMIQHQLDAVYQEAKQGALLREGMTVVIAGRPNAGKSSLLNALSGKASAIVTDIAGTTRDLLHEYIQIDGMPLHIIDTAGLHDSVDAVEKIGIERAREEINKADQILIIYDYTLVDESEDPLQVLGKETISNIDSSRISLIFNKIDLAEIAPKYEMGKHYPQLYVSAKTGAGMNLLRDHLKTLMGFTSAGEAVFTARRRHLSALAKVEQCLQQASNQLGAGAGELLAEDLKVAQQYLGEITGSVSSDELLGEIFSSFCIGK
jgi:tRNA modification GTPase